jgi:hypothetical protein
MGLPPLSHLTRAVTDREREAFAVDGVVLLKGIYPTDWVDCLRAGLDDVFARSEARAAYAGSVLEGDSQQGASSDMTKVLEDTLRFVEADALALEGDAAEPPTGRSIVETDASHWHAGMRAHNTQGPVPELLHQLTGSGKINFYSDQLFLKEPGSRVKTPFHQDKPYFLVDGGDVAVVWVPVDVVDRENGAMGYVIGSHRWGKLFKPSDFATNSGTFPEVGGISLEGLDTLPESALDEERIRYFDAEPGDVIVHHWATLHGSRGNTSASRTRRAASIRYALDGCYFYRRPSSPEPFRNTVGLSDGAPLESADRFPVVWPRSN